MVKRLKGLIQIVGLVTHAMKDASKEGSVWIEINGGASAVATSLGNIARVNKASHYTLMN